MFQQSLTGLLKFAVLNFHDAAQITSITVDHFYLKFLCTSYSLKILTLMAIYAQVENWPRQ